jgi:hypothetical protein
MHACGGRILYPKYENQQMMHYLRLLHLQAVHFPMIAVFGSVENRMNNMHLLPFSQFASIL